MLYYLSKTGDFLRLPVRLPLATAVLTCLFYIMPTVLPGGGAVLAQSWFSPGAVRCSLSNPLINLGVFSRITDSLLQAQGSFNVSCESRAYPSGYPSFYRTVEGGYCLNIDGAPGSRVLKGQGKNASVQIPFDFYNDVQRGADSNRPQDFSTPIGNGSWGIAFFDWGYRDGDYWRRRPPSLGRNYYSLPLQGRFEIRIKPIAAGRAYPAGIYANNFTFYWVAGEVLQAGTFPKVTDGPGICSRWRGERGSGQVHVQLEIKKYCNVSVKDNIDFGKQAFLNKPLTQEGRIGVDCSEGTKFGVAVNNGLYNEGGRRAMKLKDGSDKIFYEIYQDAAMSRIWNGDWGSPSSILRGTGSAAEQLFPVYAVVPPQGNKNAGSYSDTLIFEVRVLDPGGP